MRLCILAETYPSTTQTFVYESVEWLRAAGHEVAVVTEHRGDPPGAEAARFPARLVPPWLGWGKKLARLGIDPLRAAGAVRNARRWTGKSGWTASEIAARALLEPLRQAEFILGPLNCWQGQISLFEAMGVMALAPFGCRNDKRVYQRSRHCVLT